MSRSSRLRDDQWTDREGWKTAEDEEDAEERIEQEDGSTKRQRSAVTAMLLAYPRPLPLPPPQSFSPLMSPSLLSLTLRYWQTFHPPLTAGCWLPRPSYLHLRMLTLCSALLSASHGHLSLRSLALLSHLDWCEDSAEQIDEDDHDEQQRAAASNGMRLPVFHRALLTWAMMNLGVNERTVQVEQLEQCILTLYQQVTHEPAKVEESKGGEIPAKQTRRYLPLSADDEFMLREVADDAKLQWQRATAEHNKRKRKSDDDDEHNPITASGHTTASIVQRMEERKEALALQQSMPPLMAGAVSVIVRRYPSGSEIRQQARMSADKPNRPVNSRERQLSSSPSFPSSASFSSLSSFNRNVAFDPFSLSSAPQSLSPVKLSRHRNSTPSMSPPPSRSPAVAGRGGRSQLSQSPPPGLSFYGQMQLSQSPSAASLASNARGDMSTSFAAMSLRISPIARQTSNAKQK